MEDRHQQKQITQHLQKVEVQQRILQDMQRAREEATVTISNAASLFGFTENQLRDWEEKKLLKPQRRMQEAEQDGKGAKRRQYTTTELDKLAVIRELTKAGFSPGNIPLNVDEIWASLAGSTELKSQLAEESVKKEEHVHIDQRVERTEKEECWRYFVSQALRLSLLLICEDIPDTMAGIILPLRENNVAEIVRTPNDLPRAGYSLVGWLSQSRSFYTFLDTEPSFEHPSDFRIEPLVNLVEDLLEKQEPQNNILIIVQRKAKPLFMSKAAAKTVQRILGLIYEIVDQWRPSFDNNVRDWMYQATNFKGSSAISDEVLNSLANIIVQLGGKTEDGQDRWRFGCILTPEDISLPVQQRTLIVRAQSKRAPHNLAAVSAKVPGLSFRAFQSGQIIYRRNVTSEDYMIAHQEREKYTRSAIAIPLSGDNGLSIGVLYIAAEEHDAFHQEDLSLLRLVGKMIEELLMTYRSRQLPVGRLTDIITIPEVVDLSFKEFVSESDFVNDLEELLKNIHEHGIAPELAGKELSIIAVDIDNLAGIAAKYGDVVARNLSMAVGERIQSLPSVSSSHQLYHSNADRYYLLRKDIQIEEARSNALSLKDSLKKEYRIDIRRIFTRRAVLPSELLSLSDVTVRIGVHSYTYEKLKELLERYDPQFAISTLSRVLLGNIDRVLNNLGGNVVISWDREKWGYIILPS